MSARAQQQAERMVTLRGGGKAGALQSEYGSVLIYDAFASPGLDSRVLLSDCTTRFATACRQIQWEPWLVPDDFFDEAILVAQMLKTTEPRGGWTQ